MSEFTTADLQDYLDGRLGAERRAAIEAAAGLDAALSRRLDALRLQSDHLRRLGDAVLTEPVPGDMLAILGGLKRG